MFDSRIVKKTRLTDFYSANPAFLDIQPFKKVLPFFSNNKEEASKFLWIVALYADYESLFNNYNVRDRLGEILKSADLPETLVSNNKRLFDDCVAFYDRLQEDFPRKTLKEYEKHLTQYKLVLNSIGDMVEQAILSGDAKVFDSALKFSTDYQKQLERFPKLMASLMEVKKLVEAKEKNIRGGGELSLSDSGLLKAREYDTD